MTTEQAPVTTRPVQAAALTGRLARLTPGQRALIRRRLDQRARDQAELTPGQRRLWETALATEGRPVDVVCQAVRFTGGPVDLDLLAARVTGFVQAHEALRTTFREEGTRVRPVVHDALPPRLDRTGPLDQEQAYERARELAAEPFDLAHGPLLRVVLADGAAPGEAWLLLAVHNLVFDAWSFELLLDELARPEDQAPAAAPPFSRFAHAQRRRTAGPEGREAAAWWATQTAEAPPPLPTDRPRGAGTPRDGARIDFRLSARTVAGIAAAARGAAATAYAGWLAAAWAAFAEFGGREDVLLGTFTAGRDRPGEADAVGYLLNVLPVRLRDPGDGSHAARTKAARDVTRQALPHAHHPGELLAAERRLPGTQPLLDAVFVYDNLGAEERRVHGARAETADLDRGTARYDLTLAVYPGPEGAEGWLEYDTALYDPGTARRLAELFTAYAEAAAGEGRTG